MKARTLLLLACLTAPAACDWPPWRGPGRPGVSTETGLARSFPGGPTLLWTNKDAGIGCAGPAVVGDRFFTMGAFGRQEYVYALDVGTGKRLWRTAIGPLYENNWG